MNLKNMSRADVELSTGHVKETTEDAIFMRCLNDFYVWGLKNDKSLTRNIMMTGYWEAWITSWFTHNINEGDFVVDVGANCGYFTMLFDRLVGLNGVVIAYEANPAYVELLKHTMDSNSTVFDVAPYAVCDVVGEAMLTVPSEHHGSASLTSCFDPKIEEHTKLLVDATTLDFDLEYTGVPNLIKMDIEGAEELAWRGMKNILSSDTPPVVVLEYTPGMYSNSWTRELFEYGDVTRIGYDGKEEPIGPEYLVALLDWEMIVIRRKADWRLK